VGRPGIVGSRAGEAFSPLFRLTGDEPIEPDPVIADGRRYTAVDDTAELALSLELRLTHSGLLQLRARLTNTAAAAYQLDGLLIAVPVPGRAQG